jgi:ribonuclease BN (tRNA processing enzyme)
MRIQYETMSIQNSKQAPTLSQVSSSVAKMLRVVWVCHPHADHHLGLVRVIVERHRALKAAQCQHRRTGGTPPNLPTTSCCPGVTAMLNEMLDHSP